jgi:hypothetical protein
MQMLHKNQNGLQVQQKLPKALDKAGMSFQMLTFEFNEAFAVVDLQTLKF